MRYRPPATQLPATLPPLRAWSRPAQAEDYDTACAPWPSPPPPIAVNARMLHDVAGPCAICAHALMPGERAADLTTSGKTVHVSCIGASSPEEGG